MRILVWAIAREPSLLVNALSKISYAGPTGFFFGFFFFFVFFFLFFFFWGGGNALSQFNNEQLYFSLVKKIDNKIGNYIQTFN